MWQRKQTIFLSLAVLCLVVSIFFPVWLVSDQGVTRMLFPLHYTIKAEEARNTIYFPYSICAIFIVAAITVAVIEIRRFDNRMLQLKLAALNSLLMLGAVGTGFYFATQLIKATQLGGEYGLGAYLPAAAMLFNLIANRFIRKDEKLVRDSDRIR